MHLIYTGQIHGCRYVCLKEQNMLKSSREAYRRQGKVMPNPTRLTKVHHCEFCVAAWYQMAACDSHYAAYMPNMHRLSAYIDASQSSLLVAGATQVGSINMHILRACAAYAGPA